MNIKWVLENFESLAEMRYITPLKGATAMKLTHELCDREALDAYFAVCR